MRGQSVTRGERQFSGRMFLAVMVSAFGIVVGANLTLAYFAIGSFPGLEVSNTYVASQTFDARRKAQKALGWHASVRQRGSSLQLTFRTADDRPVIPPQVSLQMKGSATAAHDRILDLERAGAGFQATLDVPAGNWTAEITAIAADGNVFTEWRRMIIK